MITVPLAVEKVLFRLALLGEGLVPIARAFLELPLSLEEIEQYADQVADGRSVLKNEWGEFLSYEFPELARSKVDPKALDDCPACLGALPPPPTQGGVEVRRPVLCDTCFRAVRRLNARSPDEGVMSKLKGLFRGEEEDDPLEVMRTEHEIFYLGLRLGVEQFTHTTLAAQSRLPSHQLKERLDRMAARRYIHVGLVPSGDAVGYRFPPGLDYPKVHYDRLADPRPSGKLALHLEAHHPAEGSSPGVTFGGTAPDSAPPSRRWEVRARPTPKKKLDIRVRPRNRREP